MGEAGTVYFFTGLVGAGKTTIGGLFYRRMKARKNDILLFDGDQVREIFGRGGYSTEARKDSARRGFRLYKILTEQGVDVVCCSLAMYNEIREWNRNNLANYREIYIRVPMKILYERDQKGLYSSGAKQMVGIDLPWDEPKAPDVVIENDGSQTPEAIVDRLIKEFGLI